LVKNKCNSNCPCFWSDYSDYTGDGDYGCLVRDIEKHEDKCRLPLFVRILLSKLWEWKIKRIFNKAGRELDEELKQLGYM